MKTTVYKFINDEDTLLEDFIRKGEDDATQSIARLLTLLRDCGESPGCGPIITVGVGLRLIARGMAMVYTMTGGDPEQYAEATTEFKKDLENHISIDIMKQLTAGIVGETKIQ